VSRRARTADRLLDGLVVGLVVTLLGFVASAPRAERAAVRAGYALVEAPAPACAAATPEHRGACLRIAQASVAKR